MIPFDKRFLPFLKSINKMIKFPVLGVFLTLKSSKLPLAYLKSVCLSTFSRLNSNSTSCSPENELNVFYNLQLNSNLKWE